MQMNYLKSLGVVGLMALVLKNRGSLPTRLMWRMSSGSQSS